MAIFTVCVHTISQTINDKYLARGNLHRNTDSSVHGWEVKNVTTRQRGEYFHYLSISTNKCTMQSTLTNSWQFYSMQLQTTQLNNSRIPSHDMRGNILSYCSIRHYSHCSSLLLSSERSLKDILSAGSTSYACCYPIPLSDQHTVLLLLIVATPVGIWLSVSTACVLIDRQLVSFPWLKLTTRDLSCPLLCDSQRLHQALRSQQRINRHGPRHPVERGHFYSLDFVDFNCR